MDEKGGGDAGQTHASLIPTTDLDICGGEDVFSEDDAVGASPAEEDNVAGVEARDEEFGLRKDELEIVFFTTVAGEAGAEFEVDGHSGGGDEHACHPDEER